MRTMHAALAAVADRLGMGQILPDAAGNAELVVADVLPVYLRVVDEWELEFSARIAEFDGHLSPALSEELLRLNGTFTVLRFAVEPDRSGVVLGRRLDIRTLSDDRIADAAHMFILAVADWRRHGATALIERVMRYAQGGGDPLLSDFRL
ncbi:MAG: type III secretion system chaperone [Paracoccaceae bacterium]